MDYTRRNFLKAAGLAATALALPQRLFAGVRPDNKPNIIFILADDLGWAELGCYGNTFNETPNLDKLTAEGLRFTDAYAAAPVCSPYRAALMTGQWPARIGITNYLKRASSVHLSRDYVTIAEILKRAGYATGIVGKWHLSGYAYHGVEESLPAEHGFDEAIISETRFIGLGGGNNYFYPYLFNPEIKKRLPGKEHLPQRCNLEAVDFIERHKTEPFFLYLSHYAVHTHLLGKEELVAKYEKKPGAGKGRKAARNNPHLAAQLEVIDDGVGQITKKLDELGLAENTIIIFTSDNGGQSTDNERCVTTNQPLRAGKSTLYEGGIRVPLIIRWPKVTKSNSICNTPTSNVDFYPTFLDAAGISDESHQQLDGVSLLEIFKNPKAGLKRNTLYWHYPLKKPHFLGGRSAGAIRQDNWKLIEFFDTGEVELYNLADDIGEKHNLAEKYPDKLAELRKHLVSWRKQVGAKTP